LRAAWRWARVDMVAKVSFTVLVEAELEEETVPGPKMELGEGPNVLAEGIHTDIGLNEEYSSLIR
jgi:hypothetical protein